MISQCTGVYDGVIDGDAVIFSALDRRLHVLNNTAGQAWAAVAENPTIDDVISALAGDYEMHAEDIAPDVVGLIEHLEGLGVVHLGVPCDHGRELVDGTPGQAIVGDVSAIGSVGDEPLDAIRALGVPIIVETNDTLLRAELLRVLSPLRSSDVDLSDPADVGRLQLIAVRAGEQGWCVMRNGMSTCTTSSRQQAIRAVVAECNTAPLRHVDDAVVFHAAAADLGRGNILMAGVSNAGKSTLVAQLVLRGHAYVTDEASAVDLGSLAVRPFTKSICLEESARPLFPELDSSWNAGAAFDVDPRTLGPGHLGKGGPIVAVVFPTFDPDSAAVVRPLDKLEALRRLIGNAFVFDRVGAPAFDAMVRMANLLPFYEVVHSGGTRHLDQLENLFGDRHTLSL